MTWYVFVPFGGGGGGSGKELAPWIVVGNEPAGDTIADCDVLDTGNGAGLDAALALAAVDQKDVWVRPGTYDLGAAGGPGALTIPASVTVRGAGRLSTTVTGSPTVRPVVALDSSSVLQDLFVSVPLAAAGAAGTAAIELDSESQCRNVSLSLEGYTADETLLYGFAFVSGGGCLIDNCSSEGISYLSEEGAGATNRYRGFLDDSGVGTTYSNPNRLVTVRATSCDIGIETRAATEISTPSVTGCVEIGIRLATRAGSSCVGGCAGISPSVPGVSTYGIEIGSTGVAEQYPQKARVLGVKVFAAGGDSGPLTEGIRVDGRGHVVSGNEITNATTSIRLTTNSQNCIATSNVGATGSTVVLDEGTTNEVGHNVEY